MSTSLKTWNERLDGAKDDAAAAVVVGNILSDDDVFTFGEFFDHAKVKSLQKANAPYFQLLEIFAYGRYQDFKAKEASFPKLNEKQLLKLQLLTLVSIATDNRVLPYTSVLEQLALENERRVEELLISALYKGILRGKLDSAKHQFKVESFIGRDVRPQDIDRMFNVLAAWEKESATLLQSIDQKMTYANKKQAQVEQAKVEHVNSVEGLKATLKLVMAESEMEGMGVLGMMGGKGMMDDYGRHHGGKSKDKRGKHGY